MMSILLRIVILGLVVWLLWRLLAVLFASRHTSKPHPQDEWTEVLEGINELPETTDTSAHLPAPRRTLSGQANPMDDALSDDGLPKDDIELVLIQKAEAALAHLKKADEAERLVAYHEIMTYEKLCNTTNISAETWKKIDEIRRQASRIMDSTEPR